MDPVEDGGRRGHGPERQVVVERLRAHRALERGVLEEPFQLGGEGEPLAVLGVVERLLAHAVPGEEEAAPRGVPEGDGEHAPEASHPCGPELLVAVDDDLRVGARGEAVPPGCERLSQLGEVVDLAVEHHGDGAVLVEHRLVACRQIDDAEPPVPEPHPGADVEAVGVGAPMPQLRRHAAQEPAVHRVAGIGVDDSRDAAHQRAASSSATSRPRPPVRAR